MGVLKIPMLLLKIPLLVILSLLQAVLNILDRLSGFFTGLLTLLLVGFWIHHCILGNRENVILLHGKGNKETGCKRNDRHHDTIADEIKEIKERHSENEYTAPCAIAKRRGHADEN